LSIASAAALGPQSFIRNVSSDEIMISEDWVKRRMVAERRPREECVEELINAIARGDVTLVDPPAGPA
jgi:hypothetical protein